jgi:hypothetical protein
VEEWAEQKVSNTSSVPIWRKKVPRLRSGVETILMRFAMCMRRAEGSYLSCAFPTQLLGAVLKAANVMLFAQLVRWESGA